MPTAVALEHWLRERHGVAVRDSGPAGARSRGSGRGTPPPSALELPALASPASAPLRAGPGRLRARLRRGGRRGAGAARGGARARRRGGAPRRALLGYVAGGAAACPTKPSRPPPWRRATTSSCWRAASAPASSRSCHRLVTLRRPGAEGIRFGFMRADPAGFVTKRLALPRAAAAALGQRLPAVGGVRGASQAPGSIVRQLAEFPGGDRYLMVARAVEKDSAALRRAAAPAVGHAVLRCAARRPAWSTATGCDLSPRAPATPVGPGLPRLRAPRLRAGARKTRSSMRACPEASAARAGAARLDRSRHSEAGSHGRHAF